VSSSILVSTREVAAKFGRRHDNVLRACYEVMSNLNACNNEEFNHRNFEERTYQDSRNKTQPEILLTRDGFSILALGLTGTEEFKWKVTFLEAFNKMERKVMEEIPLLKKQLAEATKPKKLEKRPSRLKGLSQVAIDRVTPEGKKEIAFVWMPKEQVSTMQKLRSKQIRMDKTLKGIAECMAETNAQIIKTIEENIQKHGLTTTPYPSED
jgi:Rha family phage regulatory protein